MSVNLNELQEWRKKTSHIDGWLAVHDLAVFNVILSLQADLGVTNNLLEIGVFAGKSTVLIGKYIQADEDFHTCDIFDEVTDARNADEISRSYKGLSRNTFEENCLEVLGYLPVIHQCVSSQLPKKLQGVIFRFIHVDGSHLYEHVAGDLEFSYNSVQQDFGIIAVDDFRAQHTVGVAIAVWELVVARKLVPLAMTPAKIYLGSSNSQVDVEMLRKMLEEMNIQTVYEEILGHRVLRTVGLSDSELYSRVNKLKSLIPPIVLPLLRKIYVLRIFRNR